MFNNACSAGSETGVVGVGLISATRAINPRLFRAWKTSSGGKTCPIRKSNSKACVSSSEE